MEAKCFEIYRMGHSNIYKRLITDPQIRNEDSPLQR